MKTITRVLLIALTLLILSAYVPGIEVAGFYPATLTAIILGLLNLFIRPILVILTLPITLLTFGLFSIVINAALFYFAASFIQGFTVASFAHAVLGSLVVSVVGNFGRRVI